MNLKQIKAFVEVMNTGSVSEAARRLHRSQPAISAVLASLEQELDLKLSIRQGMRLKPAPEAYFLLEKSEEILRKVENVQRTMQSIRKMEQGVLEIGCMPGPTVSLMPNLIADFVDQRDSVRVSLFTRSSRALEDELLAQNADIGLADFELLNSPDSDLVSHEIVDFDCFCAMRMDDPLANLSTVTPKELSARPLATLYTNHPTSVQIQEAFESVNAELNIRFQAQFFIALFAFVERGAAYSIMDRLSVESYRLQNQGGGIVFVPFVPRVFLRTTIISPSFRPLSLLATEFYTHLKSEMLRIRDEPITYE